MRTKAKGWLGFGLMLAMLAQMFVLSPVSPVSAADPNVALYKSATAGSNESGHPAADAVDGNAATRWTASAGTFPQSLQVDLGWNYNLSGTEISWEGADAYQYKIEVSTDNTNWTIAADHTTNTTSASVDADTFTTSARYVKLTVTGVIGWHWASLWEFKIFGTDNTISHSLMSVTASSEQNSPAEVALASYAIDDDPDTFWHSEWDPSYLSLPQSITLDLGSVYSVEVLRYLPRQDLDHGMIGGYNIYASTNGTNFTLVKSGVWQLTYNEKTVFFAPTSARYIKLEATSALWNVAAAAEINIERAGPYTHVTGVSVSPSSPTINGFATAQLTATIAPSGARNKQVTWTSSNPSVASVSDTGLVSADNTGSAVITVTTDDGAYTASATVTVSPVAVTGITVNPAAVSVQVGAFKQLTPRMTPVAATNKVVNWTSSNTAVATVNAYGAVTGVAAGNATITATTQDGGFTDTVAVTVTSGTGVAAVSANDFLNSIGAATHISQNEDDPDSLADAFQYAGLRIFRDDYSADSAVIQDWINLHDATGARMILIAAAGDVDGTIDVAKQLAAEGALLAIEGPNEPNNWPVVYNGLSSGFNTTFMPVARFQRDLYAAVRAEPDLADIPVLGSSESGGAEPDNVGLQFNTIPAGAGTIMPAGTQYADYANVHNYICRLPTITDNIVWDNFDPLNTSLTRVDGMYAEYTNTWHMGYGGYSSADVAKVPRVSTETGWWTSGSNSVTEDQQGKLLLNVYLAAFKQGWSYVTVYMAKDSAAQGAWGLFDVNYDAKLSGEYLHNMTTILADTVSVTPGRLNYSIPSKPATTHDLLIQKSNGKFYLAVWSERASGSGNVTVNLGSTYGTVKIYDPTVGTSAVQTLTNVSSVTLNMSDHAFLIEM